MKALKPHRLAKLFPKIEGAQLEALRTDLSVNGQQNPILVTPKGEIIDGVHRYKLIARMEGQEPIIEEVDLPEADLLKLVMSLNFHRRHLTDEQQFKVLDAIIKKGSGGHNKKQSPNLDSALTVDEACDQYGVSRSQFLKYRKMKDKAEPEVAEAVEEGKMTVHAATQAADLPPEDQKAVAESDNPKAEVKKRKRKKKAADVAESTAAAAEELGRAQYGIIYADPPWQFETYSEAGMDRAADNHYPTMPTIDLADMDVDSAAHDDCILFLWATAPMLPDALDVMEQWGFEYKSCAVWVKKKIGTGYWFRNRHELLLLGTRGAPPLPERAADSVFEYPATKHSEKPKAIREWIGNTWPEIPKLEMFARIEAKGWDSWGNETFLD